MQKASSDAPKLVEALMARNIPVFYDGGADFYALDEVQSFLRLLELLQNPQQDLPLISSLRNPPFMFDEQELAEIEIELSEADSYADMIEECAEKLDKLDEELGVKDLKKTVR